MLGCTIVLVLFELRPSSELVKVNRQRKSLVPYPDISDPSDSSSGVEEQHTLEADKLKVCMLPLSLKRKQRFNDKPRPTKSVKKMKKVHRPPRRSCGGRRLLELFGIQLRSERHSRKFKTQSRVYEVSFQRFDQPFKKTGKIFNAMVEGVKKQCNTKARDKVRVFIIHSNLNFGIHIPFDDSEANTDERLLNELEKVAQSNTQCRIHDGDTQLEITPYQYA